MKQILFALFLFFCCAKAFADGETVCVISGSKYCSSSSLGSRVPCETIYFVVDYTIPAGYAIVAKYDWYLNGVLTKSTTDPGDPVFPYVAKQSTFSAYCKVTYKKQDNSLSNEYTSNTFTPGMKVLGIGNPAGNASPASGCASTFSYSLPSESSMFTTPLIPGTYTVSWTAPAGWTQTAISGDGLNVTFLPDAVTAGAITATITLNSCGYKETRTLNVTRSLGPSPNFTSAPNPVCSNSADYTISSVCGASNYTYTLTGTATFTANGLQSLTTTNTTVNVSFNSSGSSFTTLTAKANFSNGQSSSVPFVSINQGTPTLFGYYTILSNYHNQQTQNTLGNNNSYFIPANQNSEVNMYILNSDVSSVSWTNSGPTFPYWSPVNNGKRITMSWVSGSSAYSSKTATFHGSATNSCGTSTTTIAISVVTQGWSPYRTAKTDSSIKGIVEEIKEPAEAKRNMIKVYPNPASKNVFINIGENKQVVFRIVSLTGQRIMNKAITTSSNFDISSLKKGMYIVQILSTSDTIISSEKLMIQ